MPAYNFQARFAPAVEAGRKLHTVRRRRNRETRAGERLKLYTGMRTKTCRLLREARCSAVKSLVIDEDGRWYVDAREQWTPLEIAAFVAADTDGLMNPSQFLEFIATNYGLPFDDGVIIYWEPAD